MTVVEQAVAAMAQAAKKQEILKLRRDNEALTEALDDLIEAVPNQSNDRDWWPDELTHAMREAKAILARVETV